MAGDVRVEAQKLIASGDNIKTNRDRIKALLDDAQQTITNLSSWEGDAKENFLASFTDLRNKFETAYDVITEYINFLNTSAEQYSQAEAERANDNATFES